jgi:hypothetical protein
MMGSVETLHNEITKKLHASADMARALRNVHDAIFAGIPYKSEPVVATSSRNLRSLSIVPIHSAQETPSELSATGQTSYASISAIFDALLVTIVSPCGIDRAAATADPVSTITDNDANGNAIAGVTIATNDERAFESIRERSFDADPMLEASARKKVPRGSITDKKRSARDTLVYQTTTRLQQVIYAIDAAIADYRLSSVGLLNGYYTYSDDHEKIAREYYIAINTDNFISRANGILADIKAVTELLKFSAGADRDIIGSLNEIDRQQELATRVELRTELVKEDYEMCGCGNRMDVISETSELRCPNPSCGRVKTIVGAVFRDNQFYPQDVQKTKHGGYDMSRHRKFWMERLQAQEQKKFDPEVLEKIEYVINRDGYDRRTLTCEQMRGILKDPSVSATGFNNHAPLLVRTFGGIPPPQLSFQEHRAVSGQFNRMMILYKEVHPEEGNIPYYPYFFLQIFKQLFRNNPEKLRIIQYIHLQSRETVTKNDITFQQMCAKATPDDGFVYSPTDPAGCL